MDVKRPISVGEFRALPVEEKRQVVYDFLNDNGGWESQEEMKEQVKDLGWDSLEEFGEWGVAEAGPEEDWKEVFRDNIALFW